MLELTITHMAGWSVGNVADGWKEQLVNELKAPAHEEIDKMYQK